MPRERGVEGTTAEGRKQCSYCSHTYEEHSRKYQGYWACSKSCVCVMFKDGDFPIPIAGNQL